MVKHASYSSHLDCVVIELEIDIQGENSSKDKLCVVIYFLATEEWQSRNIYVKIKILYVYYKYSHTDGVA